MHWLLWYSFNLGYNLKVFLEPLHDRSPVFLCTLEDGSNIWSLKLADNQEKVLEQFLFYSFPYFLSECINLENDRTLCCEY